MVQAKLVNLIIVSIRATGCFISQDMMSMTQIVSTTMLVACPTAVNIDRHQAAGASIVPCYHGGGKTMMNMIEAERSDGGQIGGVAS